MFRFISALVVFSLCDAVDKSKFRTCADTGFCRRYRNKEPPTNGLNVSYCSLLPLMICFSDNFSVVSLLQYALDLSTLHSIDGSLVGKVSAPTSGKDLSLRVSVLSSGSVRVRVTEEVKRWQVLKDGFPFT